MTSQNHQQKKPPSSSSSCSSFTPDNLKSLINYRLYGKLIKNWLTPSDATTTVQLCRKSFVCSQLVDTIPLFGFLIYFSIFGQNAVVPTVASSVSATKDSLRGSERDLGATQSVIVIFISFVAVALVNISVYVTARFGWNSGYTDEESTTLASAQKFIDKRRKIIAGEKRLETKLKEKELREKLLMNASASGMLFGAFEEEGSFDYLNQNINNNNNNGNGDAYAFGSSSHHSFNNNNSGEQQHRVSSSSVQMKKKKNQRSSKINRPPSPVEDLHFDILLFTQLIQTFGFGWILGLDLGVNLITARLACVTVVATIGRAHYTGSFFFLLVATLFCSMGLMGEQPDSLSRSQAQWWPYFMLHTILYVLSHLAIVRDVWHVQQGPAAKLTEQTATIELILNNLAELPLLLENAERVTGFDLESPLAVEVTKEMLLRSMKTFYKNLNRVEDGALQAELVVLRNSITLGHNMGARGGGDVQDAGLEILREKMTGRVVVDPTPETAPFLSYRSAFSRRLLLGSSADDWIGNNNISTTNNASGLGNSKKNISNSYNTIDNNNNNGESLFAAIAHEEQKSFYRKRVNSTVMGSSFGVFSSSSMTVNSRGSDSRRRSGSVVGGGAADFLLSGILSGGENSRRRSSTSSASKVKRKLSTALQSTFSGSNVLPNATKSFNLDSILLSQSRRRSSVGAGLLTAGGGGGVNNNNQLFKAAIPPAASSKNGTIISSSGGGMSSSKSGNSSLKGRMDSSSTELVVTSPLHHQINNNDRTNKYGYVNVHDNNNINQRPSAIPASERDDIISSSINSDTNSDKKGRLIFSQTTGAFANSMTRTGSNASIGSSTFEGGVAMLNGSVTNKMGGGGNNTTGAHKSDWLSGSSSGRPAELLATPTSSGAINNKTTNVNAASHDDGLEGASAATNAPLHRVDSQFNSSPSFSDNNIIMNDNNNNNNNNNKPASSDKQQQLPMFAPPPSNNNNQLQRQQSQFHQQQQQPPQQPQTSYIISTHQKREFELLKNSKSREKKKVCLLLLQAISSEQQQQQRNNPSLLSSSAATAHQEYNDVDIERTVAEIARSTGGFIHLGSTAKRTLISWNAIPVARNINMMDPHSNFIDKVDDDESNFENSVAQCILSIQSRCKNFFFGAAVTGYMVLPCPRNMTVIESNWLEQRLLFDLVRKIAGQNGSSTPSNNNNKNHHPNPLGSSNSGGALLAPNNNNYNNTSRAAVILMDFVTASGVTDFELDLLDVYSKDVALPAAVAGLGSSSSNATSPNASIINNFNNSIIANRSVNNNNKSSILSTFDGSFRGGGGGGVVGSFRQQHQQQQRAPTPITRYFQFGASILHANSEDLFSVANNSHSSDYDSNNNNKKPSRDSSSSSTPSSEHPISSFTPVFAVIRRLSENEKQQRHRYNQNELKLERFSSNNTAANVPKNKSIDMMMMLKDDDDDDFFEDPEELKSSAAVVVTARGGGNNNNNNNNNNNEHNGAAENTLATASAASSPMMTVTNSEDRRKALLAKHPFLATCSSFNPKVVSSLIDNNTHHESRLFESRTLKLSRLLTEHAWEKILLVIREDQENKQILSAGGAGHRAHQYDDDNNDEELMGDCGSIEAEEHILELIIVLAQTKLNLIAQEQNNN